jgi:hypothetical protein
MAEEELEGSNDTNPIIPDLVRVRYPFANFNVNIDGILPNCAIDMVMVLIAIIKKASF